MAEILVKCTRRVNITKQTARQFNSTYRKQNKCVTQTRHIYSQLQFRSSIMLCHTHLDEAAVRAGAELPIVRVAPRPRAPVDIARHRVFVAARNVHDAADGEARGQRQRWRRIREAE